MIIIYNSKTRAAAINWKLINATSNSKTNNRTNHSRTIIFYNILDLKESNQHQGTTKQNILEAKPSDIDYHNCIIHQNIIGWEHFARGRIRKSFIDTVNRYYQRGNKIGRTFTGIGWIKTVARHMLTMHLESWTSRCNAIFDGPEQTKGIFTSLLKQSLLMTVEQYYEKSGVLPVEYRKWFDLPLQKFESLHIKPQQN